MCNKEYYQESEKKKRKESEKTTYRMGENSGK